MVIPKVAVDTVDLQQKVGSTDGPCLNVSGGRKLCGKQRPIANRPQESILPHKALWRVSMFKTTKVMQPQPSQKTN
jgi:hypothetical protein